MEQEKVKYLIDMINNMDIKDKLRLAICMSQSKWSGLIYNPQITIIGETGLDFFRASEKGIKAQKES